MSIRRTKFIHDLIVASICEFDEIIAIYLYGSRAQGRARKDSDWDIAVLFTHFENDAVKRALRPQVLQAALEKKFKLYDRISVVDLENVPTPLQYNIIQGERLFFENIPRVKQLENAIISAIEKDYPDAA